MLLIAAIGLLILFGGQIVLVTLHLRYKAQRARQEFELWKIRTDWTLAKEEADLYAKVGADALRRLSA
jgi:hypothetical protein